MRILLSPQFYPGKKITYTFGVDSITAQYEGMTDTFDFSNLPDGAVESEDYIETILDIHPIRRAERKNGVLSVEILNFIDEKATGKEKFPTWMEV